MKKIIPFSKDINFNTNVYEINSISLEHTLKFIDNEITGEFIISGDYKESEIVIKNEPFIYNIPFDINLDYKYNSDNINIEIDDFNYELINNNTLRLNIKVSIEGLEIIETLEEEKEEKEEKEEVIIEEPIELEMRNEESVTSIFDEFDTSEDNYISYKVHIVRENDSLESLIKLYNTSKEELEEYNNLNNLLIGSKIIIPSNEL